MVYKQCSLLPCLYRSAVCRWKEDADGYRDKRSAKSGWLAETFPDETWLLAGVRRSWLHDVGQPGRLDLESTVAWKFWSPEGTKLIGSGHAKTLERSVIKDTWRIA
jgi:hypothetical protein